MQVLSNDRTRIVIRLNIERFKSEDNLFSKFIYYLTFIFIGDEYSLLVSKINPFDPAIDDSSVVNDIVAFPFHVTSEHEVLPKSSHISTNV